jgi:ABC-type transport system substrate-binding protein
LSIHGHGVQVARAFTYGFVYGEVSQRSITLLKKFFSDSAALQKIAIVGLSIVSLMAFGLATEARADSITYQLSVANPDLFSQGVGPYANVSISSVGSTGKLWSVSATGLNNFVFGSVGAMALNVNLANAGTVTLASGCSMSPCAQVAAGNNDGFGTYTFKVNDGPGFSNGGYTSVSFQFTTSNAVSGVSDLLIANDHGATVSAHMALASNTGCTGYAANIGRNDASGPTDSAPCVATPEPSSLATAGIGLIGVLLLFGSRRLIQVS